MQKSLRTLTALAACVFTVLTPALAAAAPAATRRLGSVLDLNLPALGSAGSETLSPADEYRLGTQLMTRVRADPTYLNDPEISEYLGRLGYQLVSHAHTSTYNFEFSPFAMKHSNAFALPGGYIAMHTGTIIAAQSESELAGVLAHEISHVAQRHIARMIEGQRSNLRHNTGFSTAGNPRRARRRKLWGNAARYRNGLSGCHDPVSAELFAKRRARS